LKGAPWLRHVTPPSSVPYTVMPFQVSGQFVTRRLRRSLRARGGRCFRYHDVVGRRICCERGAGEQEHKAGSCRTPSNASHRALPSFYRSTFRPKLLNFPINRVGDQLDPTLPDRRPTRCDVLSSAGRRLIIRRPTRQCKACPIPFRQETAEIARGAHFRGHANAYN
jgi:hypothetical protein